MKKLLITIVRSEWFDLYFGITVILLLICIAISPIFICAKTDNGWYATLLLITIPGAITCLIKLMRD
jgi:hypothetical protein